MRNFLAGLWWWIRVIILVVVGLYALALLWNNSKQTASIWYWPGRPAEETSIVALAIAAFVCGGLIMTIGWALGTAMVNFRRTRAARRKRAAAQQREEIERKASMLRVKPAPAPIVRSRPEPRPQPKPAPAPAPEAVPVAVEPMPEVTLAPAPVVVMRAEPGVVHTKQEPVVAIRQQRATDRPFADQPIVEKQPAVDTKSVESRVVDTSADHSVRPGAIITPPAPDEDRPAASAAPGTSANASVPAGSNVATGGV